MNLSDYPVSGEVRRRLGRRPPALLEDGGQSRAELIRHSRLSMIDRPTAGATDGGGRDGGMGFFPFSFFVGAMAMERRGKMADGIGGKRRSSKEGRIGDGRATGRGAAVYNCEST